MAAEDWAATAAAAAVCAAAAVVWVLPVWDEDDDDDEVDDELLFRGHCCPDAPAARTAGVIQPIRIVAGSTTAAIQRESRPIRGPGESAMVHAPFCSGKLPQIKRRGNSSSRWRRLAPPPRAGGAWANVASAAGNWSPCRSTEFLCGKISWTGSTVCGPGERDFMEAIHDRPLK
jgi:hypothetical protein